jgi:hypothetical protein
MNDLRLLGVTAVGLLASLLTGCSNGPAGGPAPTTSVHPESPKAATTAKAGAVATAAPTASVETYGAPVAVPVPAASVVKVVNPKGEPPYTGPTGTLRGTIRMEGDPSPELTGIKFPPKCAEAAATYGKLFRVGLDKALADALVAVTGYQGFVPARSEAAKITIHGCAFKKRTLALTFGQRIEVANLEKTEPFMPYLDGAPVRAVMVAVPGGEPVKMYANEPGHYALRDQLPNPFLVADVYVLAYPTHDVTGLDGKYEIRGIPVGKVQVSALLPVLDKTVQEFIEIKPGDNTLDLTMKFDKKKDQAAPASSSPAQQKGPPPVLGPKG